MFISQTYTQVRGLRAPVPTPRSSYADVDLIQKRYRHCLREVTDLARTWGRKILRRYASYKSMCP